ncbi:hypothetical protein K503DRAFT_786488 [Rhizopogon vinicolor AM-OR11-026]|uniref:Uncharacterized protein n=1 Tax=Rhizopogon vinicolor AM-OR11-026 TaxID=1314800 RepID=A0A1B7MLG8_9AGAM|nr:hypothetical protein K503DRAFT_786488 [Rhizopogon vinicolor AM-OR11-026]
MTMLQTSKNPQTHQELQPKILIMLGRPARAAPPAKWKVVLQPLVEVLDVDMDTVNEDKGDYEDEPVEDQAHMGGRMLKGKQTASTKPPSTLPQVPKPKPISRKMSVVPKGKGNEKAPADEKPKGKTQTQLNSTPQEYVVCGPMGGTCNRCIKQNFPCMLWEASSRCIAVTCSWCGASKKKCMFDGVPLSDFNKLAYKLAKDYLAKAGSTAAAAEPPTKRSCSRCGASKKKCMFDGVPLSDFNKLAYKLAKDYLAKAGSTAAAAEPPAPVIESDEDTAMDVEVSGPAAQPHLASAADFPADHFVFDPEEDEPQLQVQSTVAPINRPTTCAHAHSVALTPTPPPTVDAATVVTTPNVTTPSLSKWTRNSSQE